jgi:hypothetical protein
MDIDDLLECKIDYKRIILNLLKMLHIKHNVNSHLETNDIIFFETDKNINVD